MKRGICVSAAAQVTWKKTIYFLTLKNLISSSQISINLSKNDLNIISSYSNTPVAFELETDFTSELNNRKTSMDAHHERSGSKFMEDSAPDALNKSILKTHQKGTMVFNALVTSRSRLDKYDYVPEVGVSTYRVYSFKRNTDIYISVRSISAALGAISKKAKTSNLDSQLRQVRLYLASPKTYICSRFSSEWTDTLLTLIEKSGTDANLDPMFALRITNLGPLIILPVPFL
ncbi:hypothetical protein EDC94DRAFT_586523 [Helicostylum pulchrum]|nr:hypothetical protein EDC94DRAFT_586523 [Helicostylum pulchrum]